ncbi:hypothetical protein [Microbacterium sp.]|jgi:hypothetical protein|nr:hypothetical protein [Microbacterium sp.]HWL77609.1 hypothetical protein [Microbacterium sp.]
MNVQLETNRVARSVQRWRERRARRQFGPRRCRSTFRPVTEVAPVHVA